MKTLIKNVRIIDGTGAPWFRGHVLIKGEKIKSILHQEVEAERVIDGKERFLTPGFIDIHTHGDRGILKFPRAENYLRQGVTTLIGGNCGGSEFPIAPHLKEVEDSGISLNYGILIGHGSLRRQIMGMEMRHPSPSELEKMEELLAENLKAGALGLSLGLYYVPGSFAKTEEVVALAKVVAAHGGFVSIHMRDESDYNIGLLQSIEEALKIARLAQVPVQISHLKCLGASVWHQASEALALLDQAREEGLEISFDQYPYPASSTSLNGALLPPWAQAGGEEALAERFKNAETREKIKVEVAANMKRRGGPKSLVIANSLAFPQLKGKNIEEVAALWQEDLLETTMKLLASGYVQIISFNMTEEDINQIMQHPLGMVGSDGSLVEFGLGQPHPRYYGTFPRVLVKYVKEGVLPLSEAIRRMTSAPANRLGQYDRGLIRPGFWADLVLLDLDKIDDRADFDNPHAYPQGIDLVMVNGQIALDQGQLPDQKAGMILKS